MFCMSKLADSKCTLTKNGAETHVNCSINLSERHLIKHPVEPKF